MPSSSTVVIALKYSSGVLIGSDSQASDLVAQVRWPVQKTAQIGRHPLVFGFSGSIGTSDRVFDSLQKAALTTDTFNKRRRIQNRLDAILKPEYESLASRKNPAPGFSPPGIWGLAALWAENEPGILEYELSGDSCWHQSFHAIGSGAQTAYAAFRVLGGAELRNLRQRTAITSAVRILETVISVDVAGVDDPIHLWRVDRDGVHALSNAEINTHSQLVDEWERLERERLFESDARG